MQRFSLYGVHKRDYQESVTFGQTDARTHARTHRQTPDKVIPMCRYASQATQKVGQLWQKSILIYNSSYQSLLPNAIQICENIGRKVGKRILNKGL